MVWRRRARRTREGRRGWFGDGARDVHVREAVHRVEIHVEDGAVKEAVVVPAEQPTTFWSTADTRSFRSCHLEYTQYPPSNMLFPVLMLCLSGLFFGLDATVACRSIGGLVRRSRKHAHGAVTDQVTGVFPPGLFLPRSVLTMASPPSDPG